MDKEASTSFANRAHTPPPSLPSWDSLRLDTSASPRSSSSHSTSMSPIAASPVFTNASPYSPHSKTLWQLSQSEPSLVPDVYPSETTPLELVKATPGGTPSAKEKRRNTLHVDISISRLGHMRDVSDDDPVLTLGDSSLDTEKAEETEDVLIVDEEDDRRVRGRSRLRILGDGRSSSLPESPDTEKEEKQKEPLHAPLHIACVSETAITCPHGANCPFSHTHKKPPSAHISLISSPAFSPPPAPSKHRSQLSALLPPMSPDASAGANLSKSNFNLPTGSTHSKPGSGDWIQFPEPITPDWFQTHSRTSSKRNPITPPRRARTPKYDSLGLPPHPLVPQMDLSQYRGFKRAHRSVGSNRSIDSVLSGAESASGEENVFNGKSTGGSSPSVKSGRSDRGRRSRRGSLTGKYAVADVPPFKGSRSTTPALVTGEEKTMEGPTEQVQPKVEEYQSAPGPEIYYQTPPPTNVLDASRRPPRQSMYPTAQPTSDAPSKDVGEEKTATRKQLDSPPVTPQMDVSVRRTAGGRNNFSMAIKALGDNMTKHQTPTSSLANPAPVNETLPKFVFPTPNKDHQPLLNTALVASVTTPARPAQIDTHVSRHSISSKTSDEPTSPTFSVQSGSTRSSRSIDPISLFGGPSFTDPSRPLFSGYTPFGAPPSDASNPLVVGGRHRGAEWVKKQREKDLRQAQRLEKALEEKKSGLKRKLEWRPPIVEEPGYGYGDGPEVPVEVTLDTGEVMKVLSDEERKTMEKDLERTETSLERVRSEILEHGGTLSIPSTATSPVTTMTEIRSPTTSISSKRRELPPHLHSPPPSGLRLGQPRKEELIGAGMAGMTMPPMSSGMSAKERVMARSQMFKRNMDLFGDMNSPNTSSNSTSTRPEVVVKRSSNVLDMGLFNAPARMELEGTKRSSNVLDLGMMAGASKLGQSPPMNPAHFNANNSLMGSLAQTGLFSTKNMSMAGWPTRQGAAMNFDEDHQVSLFSKPQPSSQAERQRAVEDFNDYDPAKADTGDLEWQRAVRAQWDSPPQFHSRGVSGDSSVPSIDLPQHQEQPQVSASATPIVEAKPAPQPPATQAIQQRRRISMSTAIPGEEASSQTMQGFSFDDSDEDEEGEADDSREYLSAEEGYETANDEPPEPAQPEPYEEPPKPADSPSRPLLQRKRSSTTTDLRPSSSDTKHKASPLDDWTFDFASRRQPRDVVSPGPYPSTMSTNGGRSTPPNRHHGRKLSQDSAQSGSTPRFGIGAFAPSNTPTSPPPRRTVQLSPLADRSFESQQIATFPSLRPSEPVQEAQFSSTVDQQPEFDQPFFVVKRSANVLDEAANVIQYATARVMSGGVRIGSIQPRVPNGVIPEEEEEEVESEDMEAVFETPEVAGSLGMVTGPAVVTPSTTFSPTHGQYMALPPAVPQVPAYPMGVPVPGQPHSLSVPPPVQAVPVPIAMAPQSIMPMQAQLVASSLVHHPQPLHANLPPSVPIHPTAATMPGSHRSSIAAHHTGHQAVPPHSSSSASSINATQAQPIEYCGDFRTTGHCRFGARCRYSHDIEPRVKTSRNASAAIYRPSVANSTVPASPIDPLPPVPPGYNLSNVLPQPHHIPGVPLSQQPASPFVYAPSSTVAHPLTAPAATAAADRGVPMSDKEKAKKILKSLGLNPQQVLPHRPAPVVMADGEIRYDLTRRRSTNPEQPDYSPSRPKPPSRLNSVDMARGSQDMREIAQPMIGGPREASAVMGSSAGMVVEGEEEDIWTVSSGRQKRPSVTSTGSRETERRARHAPEREYLYQSENQNRAYSPMNPPPSYSPVQHVQPIQHPQYYHPSPQPHPAHHAQQPHAQAHHAYSTVSTPAPTVSANPQATLTQEEVFKVLAALGIGLPGNSAPPATPSVPPAYGPPQGSSGHMHQAPGPANNYPGAYDYSQRRYG